MLKLTQSTNYFFVDESGDPIFYDSKGRLIVGEAGCAPLLILGLIKTQNPSALRSAVENIRSQVMTDPYLQGVPSLKKTGAIFHAKDDCPEVRERFFKAIQQLDFKAVFYVGRKNEALFKRKHMSNPRLFYDDLVSKLFENQLHTASQNKIYYAMRENRARAAPLNAAIERAISTFEKKWDTKVNSTIELYPQRPIGEPCLQIADYLNWAVYRVFTKRETRFFNFMRDKISMVVDLYDFKKYPRNYYNRSNPLDVNKISPL